MDSFFKENLILPKSLTNLEYGGTQMPLKIVTWPSMLTGGTLTAVLTDILAREVLGVNTSLVCTYGGPHAIRMVGGCANPMDQSENCRTDSQPAQDPPYAHTHVEAWVNTEQEVMDAAELTEAFRPAPLEDGQALLSPMLALVQACWLPSVFAYLSGVVAVCIVVGVLSGARLPRRRNAISGGATRE